jgi:D-tyrosyl-tRNA(Tyr) deacylase
VLQRVREASVEVGGKTVARIDAGHLLLVGFTDDDGEDEVRWMAEKVVGLRVFNDAGGKMNLSLEDVAGDLLVVSQFTLYGDARKGRRPSFVHAAHPDRAVPLYELFLEELRDLAPGRVEAGIFGAEMKVALVNDGPVTLTLEKEAPREGVPDA